jgi:hypothetical protein
MVSYFGPYKLCRALRWQEPPRQRAAWKEFKKTRQQLIEKLQNNVVELITLPGSTLMSSTQPSSSP